MFVLQTNVTGTPKMCPRVAAFPSASPPVKRQLGVSTLSVCWGRDNEAIHSHYSTITKGVGGPPRKTFLEVCCTCARTCTDRTAAKEGIKRHKELFEDGLVTSG